MSNASSKVVDERIMEFKFHNDQFEAGVRQSMNTLEQLKQTTASAMHSIGNGLSGLKNLFTGFRTKSVEDNVDQISKRFSTMGVIGTTVLQTLTQKAVNLGLSLGHKVLSPLTSIFSIVKNRGWARAEGVKQAQFMISNLGLEWENAKDDINDAVDGTRFGFDEAATAAAQLATSGIKFGEDMPDVLKAIGNAASMANVEFSDMAHIFTTMASNGRVYGDQLMQMSNRGINATKALADYLGKSEAEVKKLVSAGKVSFEDFTAAINQTFGDAAHKANETFSGVLANNKAVFARIGQTYAEGFMDAAKVVLNHTLPVLKAFEKAIKPIGVVASKAMMLVAHIISPIVDRVNFGPLKDFIDNYIVPLGDYIDELDGKIRGVQSTAEDAAETAEDLLEMANKVIRGDYGNGQARKDKLEELGYSYELIQNKVNELLGCSFRYEVAEGQALKTTEESTEATGKQAEALDELNKKYEVVGNLLKFVSGIQSLGKMLKYTGEVIYEELIKRGIGLIPSLISFVAKRLGTLGMALGAFSDWVVKFDFWGKLIRYFIGMVEIAYNVLKAFITPLKNFFDEILHSEAATKVFEDLVKIFERLLNVIFGSANAINNAYNSFKNLSGIQRLSSKLGKALNWLRTKVIDLVIGALEKLHEILGKEPNKNKGVFKLFSEDGLLNKGANLFADFIDYFERKIGNFSSAINSKVQTVKSLLERFVGFLTSKFPALGPMFDKAKESVHDFFSYGGFMNPIRNAIEKIGDFIDRVKQIEGVQKFIQSMKDLGVVLKEYLIEGLSKLLEMIDKTFGTSLKGKGDEFINFFGEGGVLDTAGEVLARLASGFTNIPGALDTFFNAIQNLPDFISSKGEIGAGIVSFIENIYKEAEKGLPNFFTFITKGLIGSLGGATASLAKEGLLGLFGDQFSENIESVVNGLMKFINWILKGDKALKIAKGSFADASGSFDDFVDILKNLGQVAGPVVKDVFDRFANAKDWGIWDALELLKTYGLAKILIKTGSAVGSFSKILKNFSKVVGGFTGLGKKVEELIGSFKAPFDALTEAFKNLGTSFTSLRNVFTGAESFLKNWGDVNNVLKQWRKKPLTTALRDFAISIALIAASIALLGSDFVNYDKIRENKDILLGFAGFFVVMAAMFALTPPDKLDAMSKAFIGLGVGLVAITAAIAIFGHMKPETLIQGGIAVAALMVSLAFAAKIAAGSSGMAGLGFLAMALAINILIPAVLAFGKIGKNDWQSLVIGGGAVALFMVAMGLAARVAGSSGGAAMVGFLAMSIALNLLIPALMMFAHIAREDWTVLAIGGGAVVVFMLAMALAAKIASGAGGMAMLGFLAIALAVNLLIPAVLVFGKMRWETLLKGGGAILVFMTVMALAIRVASKNGGKAALAFLAIAVAVNLIVPALILLSTFKFTKILGAAIALGGVMVALGYSIKMASQNKGSLPAAIALAATAYLVAIALVELSTFPMAKVLAASVSLALVIAALAIAFNSLRGMNIAEVLANAFALMLAVAGIGAVIVALVMLGDVKAVIGVAISLGALAVALSFALRLLGGIDPGMALKAGLALDAFALLVAALAGVLIAVGTYITSKVPDLAEKVNKFGLVIHGFFAGLKGQDITKESKEVEEAGSSLSTFADNISRFLDLLDETDETKAANAEHLASAIWALTKTEFVHAISNWLGLDADFSTFGDSLVAFAKAFFDFVDVVEQHNEVGDDKLSAVATATKEWIEIAKMIEPNTGLFPTIAGITDMGKFGTQMATFGEGFYSFIESVKGISDIDLGLMSQIESATKYMIGIAEALKPNEGIIPDLIGISNIGKFGLQLANFATGFKNFHETTLKIGDIQIESIEKLAEATKPMIETAALLTETGGVWQKLAGEKDLASFGDKLAVFAEKIVSFCETTNTDVISPIRLMAIGNALTKIATLDGNANDAYAYLSAFSEAFGRLGASIGTFGENSKEFNPEDLENAMSSFERLRDFISSLKGFSENDMDTFFKAFKDVSKTSTKKFAEGFGDAVDDVSAAIKQFFADVAGKVADDNGSNFKLAGSGAASKYGEGFTSHSVALSATVNRVIGTAVSAAAKCADKFVVPGQSAASGYSSGIDKDAWKSKNSVDTMARDALAELNGVYNDFYDRGKWAAEGFADGIEDAGSRAVDRAWELANQAANALASALDEASPSKRTRKMGVYFVEGFANGIETSYKMSENAVDLIASSSLAAMMLAVSSLAEMIDQELPNEPIIRPVIDTSGVEYGMLRINGMLNSMPSPVSSMLRNAATDQNKQLSIKAQNVSDYTEQFDQLIESNGQLIDAVRQNRYAIIDGDSAFSYIDRRLGQAQG